MGNRNFRNNFVRAKSVPLLFSIRASKIIVSPCYGKLEFSKHFVRAKSVPLLFSMCTSVYISFNAINMLQLALKICQLP